MRLQATVLSSTRGPGADGVPHLVHLPGASGMPRLGLMVPLDASAAVDLGALLLFWDLQTTPVLGWMLP